MKELIEKENKDDEEKIRQHQREEYDRNWWIAEAMIHYGGSFVSLLGKLHRHGDLSNQRQLRTAFPELFERYSKMIEKAKKEYYED